MDGACAVDATKPCAETGVTLAGGGSMVDVMCGGGACDGGRARLRGRSERDVQVNVWMRSGMRVGMEVGVGWRVVLVSWGIGTGMGRVAVQVQVWWHVLLCACSPDELHCRRQGREAVRLWRAKHN